MGGAFYINFGINNALSGWVDGWSILSIKPSEWVGGWMNEITINFFCFFRLQDTLL